MLGLGKEEREKQKAQGKGIIFFDRSQQGNPSLFFYFFNNADLFKFAPTGSRTQVCWCYSGALTTRLEALSRQRYNWLGAFWFALKTP